MAHSVEAQGNLFSFLLSPFSKILSPLAKVERTQAAR